MTTMSISVPIPCANAHHASRSGQSLWTPIVAESLQPPNLTKARAAWLGTIMVCGACWRAFATHHAVEAAAGRVHLHGPLDCDAFLGSTFVQPAHMAQQWPPLKPNQKG